jgi:hypothetical protein
LKPQELPGELDHAAADPGIACFGEPLFPPLRPALVRRACQAGSFCFHHLCYPNYGALTSTPAGLSPAEHASIRWTHNRTCGFPCIRLSDKTSRLRPRHVAPKPGQTHEPGRSPSRGRFDSFVPPTCKSDRWCRCQKTFINPCSSRSPPDHCTLLSAHLFSLGQRSVLPRNHGSSWDRRSPPAREHKQEQDPWLSCLIGGVCSQRSWQWRCTRRLRPK